MDLNKRIEELETQILILKEENYMLQTYVDNLKNKNKNKTSYIYIMTSKNMAKKNTFKIGKTNNLKKELSFFNNNKNGDDKFYYCFHEKVYNCSKIESTILEVLDGYRNNKDITFDYVNILKIFNLVINNFNKIYDYKNYISTNLKNMCTLPPLIPEPWKIDMIDSD